MAFREDTPVEPRELMTIVQSRPNSMKLRPDGKLVVTRAPDEKEKRVQLIRNLLRELSALTPA